MKERIEEKTPEIFKNLPAKLRAKLMLLQATGMASDAAFDSLSEEEQVLIEKAVEYVAGG